MREKKIIEAMSSFSVWEIEDIARYFGAPVDPRMGKEDMAGVLCSFISESPRKWLPRMLCTDLNLLKTLSDAGPGKAVTFGYNEQTSVLELTTLLDSEVSEDGSRRIWIGKDLHSLVAPLIDSVIEEARSSGKYELEQVMMGYLHLYGLIPLDRFLGEVMYDYYTYKGGGDFTDFIMMLYDNPVVSLCREDDENTGQSYLCSPCVTDPFNVIRARERYPQVKGYRHFTVKDALEAGEGYPYNTFGMRGKYGARLIRMLRSLGYSGESLETELHEIWINSQGEGSGDSMEDLYFSVTQKMNEIGSFEEYRECMQVISDYANHTPKWFLKGYSAAQKNLLWIDISSDEEKAEWDEGFDPDPEATAYARESFRMPQGSVPQMALPGKIYIPHIGLDDPCPCGSGLKYRNCHGRHPN